MPLLVCHVGWMNLYEGLVGKPDRIVGGGSYVQKHGAGGEVCNFLRCNDGYDYGHVETMKKKKNRPISIELLCADKDADHIDGVDVLWTATHPMERSRRIIGWYQNARVFRDRQYFDTYPSLQHRRDKLGSFRIRARGADAVLVPLDERTLKLGHGKGWIGQANWWFPEDSKNARVKSFVGEARRLMSPTSGVSLTKRMATKRGKWGGNSDPERKVAVEAAAIAVVKAYFAEYQIESVESENLGWDLRALKRGKELLRLEVKGLSAGDLQVGLTPREYRALLSHMKGEMDSYRLCVVTEALGNQPKIVVFRYSTTAAGWTNECTGRGVSPKITQIAAAIVSLP